MSDAELVSSILSGDTGRFEALVDRYMPMVRAVCASHVYTGSVHDDLVQETFVEGYVKLNTLRRGDRFGPWLAQIARRKCQTWLRREGSKQRALDRFAHEPAPPAEPISEVARSELRAWVRKTVHQLPVKTREAVLLYYLEGCSVAETARCLGAREGAIKKRLQYGRELLGDAVREHVGRQPEDQSTREGQKKRVLAALPLAAAPWLKTGTAAAATGAAATGLGISTAALYAVAALVVAGVAIGVWRPWEGESASGRSDPSDPSDSPASPASNLALASGQPLESEGAPDDAATGDLTVKVTYQVVRREGVGNVSYRMHYEDGRPAQGAFVRLVRVRFNQARFDKIMDIAGIEGPVREVLALRSMRINEEPAVATAEALGVTREDMAAADKQLRDAWDEIEKLGFTNDCAIGWFLTLESDTQLETLTNAEGLARFGNLSPGLYALRAWATAEAMDDDHSWDLRRTHQAQVHEGKENTTAISVRDIVSRIQGRVVNAETGEPVPQAKVTAETTGGMEAQVHTDAEGEFRFLGDLGHGRFQLKLDPSLGSGTAEGFREVGKPVWVELKARFGTVSGTVYAYDGTPAPDVTIMRFKVQGYVADAVARTDDQGRFTYPHDGGVMILFASGGNVRSESLELELEREKSAEVEFTLPEAARVFVHFRTEDGSASDKFVRSHMRAEYEGGNINILRDWIRQQDDSYLINYLRPAHYEVFAFTKQADYAYFSFDIVEKSSEYRFDVNMKRATAPLEVQVVNEHRVPVPNATVTIRPVYTAATYRNGETDGRGVCLFEAMPPGEYMVSSGAASVTAIVPEQKRVELVHSTTKEPRTRYIGTECIRALDGTRDGIELSTEHSSVFVVAPTGKVTDRISGIGTNTLYFVKSGYTVGVAELTTTAEQWNALTQSPYNPFRDPIEIVLGEEGTIYGEVTDETGNPIATAGLRVLPLEVWQYATDRDMARIGAHGTSHGVSGLARLLAQNAQTNADGAFRLRYLAPGYYVVGAPVDGTLLVSEPVEVRAGHETGPVVLHSTRE